MISKSILLVTLILSALSLSLVGQDCLGQLYLSVPGVDLMPDGPYPQNLISPKFLIKGGAEAANGNEISNINGNGLVICSPSNSGIYSTGANVFSGFFTNLNTSSRAAVYIGHGDDNKMDLQLEGTGRTAAQDGYVINIDTNEDGDESFLIAEGGGNTIFSVTESIGTTSKNLEVQGKAKITDNLSINGDQKSHSLLSLKRGSLVLSGSRNLISLDGLSESWILYIDYQSGDLCFQAETGNGKHCFSNTSFTSNARHTNNKKSQSENRDQEQLNIVLLKRIAALEQQVLSLKG